MSVSDLAIQNTEKQLGMRDAYDPNRIGMAAIIGGALSFGSTAGISYGISKFTGGAQSKLPKNIKDQLPKQKTEPNLQVTTDNNLLQQTSPRTFFKKYLIKFNFMVLIKCMKLTIYKK